MERECWSQVSRREERKWSSASLKSPEEPADHTRSCPLCLSHYTGPTKKPSPRFQSSYEHLHGNGRSPRQPGAVTTAAYSDTKTTSSGCFTWFFFFLVFLLFEADWVPQRGAVYTFRNRFSYILARLRRQRRRRADQPVRWARRGKLREDDEEVFFLLLPFFSRFLTGTDKSTVFSSHKRTPSTSVENT